MSENVYKNRRAFLIPLIVIVVLLFLLFLISLLNRQSWEIIVLAILFFTSLFSVVVVAKKEIVVNDQGVKIKKVFRCKEFEWTEITHLGVVVLKKKVYFLLTTHKGFYIFSNLLENHALLVRSLMDRLGEEKVEVEVKKYLEHPQERLALVIMSWLAVGVIMAMIILRMSEI
ncbi:MAG: hypothetical protein AB2L12_11485 [Smithellaceae bacterium]